MTKALTFVLFWLLVFPIGTFARWLGVKMLDFRWRAPVRTYWSRRPAAPAARKRYGSRI